MEEITFEDVLTHYKNKIKDYTERLGDVQSKLKKAYLTAGDCWSGAAAGAFENALNGQIEKLERAQAALFEAMSGLTLIKSEFESANDPKITF